MLPARILVVEDEKLISKSLQLQLGSLGYAIAGAASSGEDAVRQAIERQPDLILMDIHLGDGIDGVEAANLIRKEIDVPIIFLTAHSDDATLKRAKLAGPHGYLLKPYEDSDLKPAIEIGLYKHEAERQLAEYRRQLEEANARLELLATTDGLTGLNNRRAFQSALTEEVNRATRISLPLSLLLLDVDHFKQFNDDFGHPAGDVVLRDLAHRLGECTRSTDFVARYGGEEFAILLPNTDQAGAVVLAERVRRAVAEGEWRERAVTVSIGAATYRTSFDSDASFVSAADAALYRSKKGGRNRVCHANEPDAFLPGIERVDERTSGISQCSHCGYKDERSIS